MLAFLSVLMITPMSEMLKCLLLLSILGMYAATILHFSYVGQHA